MTVMPVLALTLGLLAPPEPSAPVPTHGTHLLLADGRVLVGDVERIGEQYRVRRQLGDSFWPTRQVLYLGSSLDDTYRFLHNRVGPSDAAGRLKLARWCHVHNLKAEALLEANEAARLRPGQPETVSFLRMLKRMSSPAPAIVGTAPRPGAVEAAEPPPPPEIDAPPPADCSAAAQALFYSKVQPLLMNACAGCHAGSNGGSYHLIRTYPDGGGHRRATQVNLAATFAQLKKAQPGESPLLVRSVTAHGGLPYPPIKDRHAKAFKLLEQWTRQALRLSPTARMTGPAPASPAPPRAPTTPAPPTPFGASRSAAPPQAPKPPRVIDPTDPANFNPPSAPGKPPAT